MDLVVTLAEGIELIIPTVLVPMEHMMIMSVKIVNHVHITVIYVLLAIFLVVHNVKD